MKTISEEEIEQIKELLKNRQNLAVHKILNELEDSQEEKLKKDLEENQQISDRISGLIVERDDFKKSLTELQNKIQGLIRNNGRSNMISKSELQELLE